MLFMQLSISGLLVGKIIPASASERFFLLQLLGGSICREMLTHTAPSIGVFPAIARAAISLTMFSYLVVLAGVYVRTNPPTRANLGRALPTTSPGIENEMFIARTRCTTSLYGFSCAPLSGATNRTPCTRTSEKLHRASTGFVSPDDNQRASADVVMRSSGNHFLGIKQPADRFSVRFFPQGGSFLAAQSASLIDFRMAGMA